MKTTVVVQEVTTKNRSPENWRPIVVVRGASFRLAPAPLGCTPASNVEAARQAPCASSFAGPILLVGCISLAEVITTPPVTRLSLSHLAFSSRLQVASQCQWYFSPVSHSGVAADLSSACAHDYVDLILSMCGMPTTGRHKFTTVPWDARIYAIECVYTDST